MKGIHSALRDCPSMERTQAFLQADACIHSTLADPLIGMGWGGMCMPHHAKRVPRHLPTLTVREEHVCTPLKQSSSCMCTQVLKLPQCNLIGFKMMPSSCLYQVTFVRGWEERDVLFLYDDTWVVCALLWLQANAKSAWCASSTCSSISSDTGCAVCSHHILGS